MGNRTANIIAAERRRRIYSQAVAQGSVSVSDLVEALGVTENTIRHDLDVLHEEGKLLRSHGGAVPRERSIPASPYSEARTEHMPEKSRIAAAALRYLPESGQVCINAGSTTHQLAIRIPSAAQFHVATNSPEIALHLASNTHCEVDLLGGRVVAVSAETDASLAMDVLDKLYWDVSFMGLSAIDIEKGITSINLDLAHFEGLIMEHSNLVIALCDSSKIGRFSYAKAGPASLIDVLITDGGADPEILDSLRDYGVEVLIAEEEG